MEQVKSQMMIMKLNYYAKKVLEPLVTNFNVGLEKADKDSFNSEEYVNSIEPGGGIVTLKDRTVRIVRPEDVQYLVRIEITEEEAEAIITGKETLIPEVKKSIRYIKNSTRQIGTLLVYRFNPRDDVFFEYNSTRKTYILNVFAEVAKRSNKENK